MTPLRDPQLERFRSEFAAVLQFASQGATAWPRVAAIVAASRTYLARQYLQDVPNFDVLAREPDWTPVVPNQRRAMMGVVATLEDDERISSQHQRNEQKFRTAVNCLATSIAAIDQFSSNQTGETHVMGAVERIRHVLDRFQQIADPLRSRHSDRPPLELNDEYDVQFLLGGLLRLYFDDVESESWTPSYAGGSARIDFLLSQEVTAVEVKYASRTLSTKKLREQLIVDCDYYRQHPRCRRLVCFVYDRNGNVENPRGFESALTEVRDGLEVTTLVRPIR